MFQKGCANTYLRPVSYVFLFITLALTMIALCTSNWYSTVTDGERIFQGVWNVCAGKQEWTANCAFLPDKEKAHLHHFFDIADGKFLCYRISLLVRNI